MDSDTSERSGGGETSSGGALLYGNFQIMIIALLAPELIIPLALRHWFSAKKIAEKYKIDEEEEDEKDEGQVDDQFTSDQTHLLANSESQLPGSSEDHAPEPSESCLLEYLIAPAISRITSATATSYQSQSLLYK
uniref:Uncharacterized protein n=1 Tax=Moniliophthora roreri TaxID=221103 RepID=A0A0W0G7E4_MONRR